jgi:hypothetical protein
VVSCRAEPDSSEHQRGAEKKKKKKKNNKNKLHQPQRREETIISETKHGSTLTAWTSFDRSRPWSAVRKDAC